MKKVVCDLFKTDFTEDGVVVEFSNIAPYVAKTVFKSKPIPFPDYIEFINDTLYKVKGIESSAENKTGLSVEIGKSTVAVMYTNGETVYKITMKPMMFNQWFGNDYEILASMVHPDEK